ncbi:MAG: hypothetical protein E7A11_17990 [Clostridium sp.]|jgi:hypothetical protein|uniref:hypothetical protein n=1 Tax=Clostridium TaxID=1485 RepID=UPI00232D27DB|nr:MULTISPECIES: hypothetical protein [Clostridium]MDU1096515.1 hypothetical protein [Clostridioides difficile]MDB2122291.1 hypothetical protein [Clostridium paraputrificum]MDU1127143.1 hypothetical protein [Clostridium sp.]MDU3678272.1 hypothetical protein [Clostridium sp.]MDU4429310.1 hypothetical protein [Clostridium sp.]
MKGSKYITVNDGIGVSEQRELLDLTRGLVGAINREEFLQIVGVYNKAINRLREQAKKEGIEI